MMRHLVLVGAGYAHLLLLAQLRHNMPADLGVTVITRQQEYVQPVLLTQAIAHSRNVEQSTVDIAPLLQKKNVRWLQQNVQTIRAADKTLLLDDGRSLHFDWLSIDLEPVQNRDLVERQLPGARANGLFVFPRENFCSLWPRVAALAADKPLRVALIAATEGSASPLKHFNNSNLELALAIAHAFKGSALTLITNGQPLAVGPAVFQSHIQALLKRRNITVLPDAASAILPREIILASSARLACDVPVVATPPCIPLVISSSDLQQDADDEIELDGWQRSTSHPYVFVPRFSSRSTVNIWLSGLTNTFNGKPLTGRAAARVHVAGSTPTYLACGNGKTLVVWGKLAWQSRLADYLRTGRAQSQLKGLSA